jgi:pimeloyl-ACP methyl ester carboxylesterase
MNRSTKGLIWAGAAVAVPAAINAVIASRAGRAEQPLPGDIAYYDWAYGRVAYYRLGIGDPLLLVHNPNAGGSAWEWRKVFPELANRYTVYAIDLLGYGLSEKPNIDYTGAIFADLVNDFLIDVIDRPADVVGSALSASYLVNTAVRRPESIKHLALTNPTGAATRVPDALAGVARSVVRSPLLGTSIYNGMVSMSGIRNELMRHLYYDPDFATPDVVNYLYTAAHQPGSRNAAAALLAGRLDLPMRMAFADLTQPVLLVWGRQAYYTPDSDAADLLYRHPQARLEILDECGMLPQDEKAGEFIRLVTDFLSQPTDQEMAA